MPQIHWAKSNWKRNKSTVIIHLSCVINIYYTSITNSYIFKWYRVATLSRNIEFFSGQKIKGFFTKIICYNIGTWNCHTVPIIFNSFTLDIFKLLRGHELFRVLHLNLIIISKKTSDSIIFGGLEFNTILKLILFRIGIYET